MNELKAEALKNFLRIGIFIGGCGFILIFFEPRDSPEFILSVCSTLIGAALVLGVIITMRLSR
jgi:hypothetical protein